MLAGTTLGIFFVPVFFLVIRRLFSGHGRHDDAPPDALPHAATGAEVKA